ncbi:hypothetical protein COM38_26930 [Bacillus toyonensis]|uniref:hypothetical protein n=1 Tax=Bacillus toyonensis TaxID=155322 RepID=UPI000BED4F7C|nr:hypothetical protein [Bacillus toyonensis]PEC07535.1 hypothetical protein CON55_28640 [Bacillus toyonensis]PGD49327.1 hypothetical protein COM38_26930 [Bacillus toyonensis]
MLISELSISKARNWLLNLDIAPTETERQLQRLLGIYSAQTLESRITVTVDEYLYQLVDNLDQFDWKNYSGDPILALTVHTLLHKKGINHPSLTELSSGYGLLLQELQHPLDAEFSLVCELLLRLGIETPKTKIPEIILPQASELIYMDRKKFINVCNVITAVTAFGSRKIEVNDLDTILPHLTISYAMNWDLEIVCLLLRTCNYLELCHNTFCNWAVEWLLDQQHSDGYFGLLLPEIHCAGGNPENWEHYFLTTVGVLWTLNELYRGKFQLPKEKGSISPEINSETG